MQDSLSKKQLINNELAARSVNKRVKQNVKEHTPTEEHDSLKIDFICECADLDCRERIQMTMEEYEDLHKSQASFVIVKGHQAPVVEKVTEAKQNLLVVEK